MKILLNTLLGRFGFNSLKLFIPHIEIQLLDQPLRTCIFNKLPKLSAPRRLKLQSTHYMEFSLNHCRLP